MTMSRFDKTLLSMAKANQAIVAATVMSMIAILFAGYSMTQKNTSNKSSNLAPALTEEEAVEVMTAMNLKVKKLTLNMLDVAENIKGQIQQQGGQEDEAVILKNYILPHFIKAFEEQQEVVYDELDVDGSDVEEAVRFYISKGSKELKKISESIRLVFRKFGAQVAEDDEEEQVKEEAKKEEDNVTLTEQQVVAMLQTLAEKMIGHTNNFAIEFKSKYGLPETPEYMDAFQMGMSTLSEEAEKLLLLKSGVTPYEFQIAVNKFRQSGSPAIENTISQMQLDNQVRLGAHGIVM